MASIDHKSILPIREVYSSERNVYFVEVQCAGGTLLEKIE